MKPIHTLFAGIAGVAVLGLGAATATLAQPAEAPAGQGPQRMMRMDPAQMAQMRQQMQQRRAERLRAVLQLRPEQEAALQAFITAMAPPEGAMGHRMRGPGGPGGPGAAPERLTTPQRLDRQAQRMTQHQQAFQRRADAIRRFYAQLSPTQQQAFDALHQGGHRGGRGMGGPGMRGHHRGGPGGPGMGPPPGGGPGGPGFAPDGDDY